MAALTTTVFRPKTSSRATVSLEVAAGAKIFGGALVSVSTVNGAQKGAAVPSSDSADHRFVGFATPGGYDNTTGTRGDLDVKPADRWIEVSRDPHAVEVIGFTVADKNTWPAFGDPVFVVDDQTVTVDAAAVTNDVQVGTVMRLSKSEQVSPAAGGKFFLIDPEG